MAMRYEVPSADPFFFTQRWVLKKPISEGLYIYIYIHIHFAMCVCAYIYNYIIYIYILYIYYIHMYVPTWWICGWCFTLWHSITHWETPGPSSQTQRPVESSRLSMLVTSPNPGGSRFTFRKTGGTLCWKWMEMMDGNGLSVPISLGGVHLKTIQWGWEFLRAMMESMQ